MAWSRAGIWGMLPLTPSLAPSEIGRVFHRYTLIEQSMSWSPLMDAVAYIYGLEYGLARRESDISRDILMQSAHHP